MFDSLPVEGDLHLPDNPEPAPALVIVPGRGYHRGLPLIQSLAAAAVEAGFVAARFDWRDKTSGAAPENDAGALADVRSVLTALKAHPRVDKSRIAIVGKSMGSSVGWQAFRADRALGVALLTPLAPNAEARARSYPGFAEETRPILLVAGKGDPFAANLGQLALATLPNVTAVIVGGGHCLCENDDDARFVPLAVEMTVAWLKQVLG